MDEAEDMHSLLLTDSSTLLVGGLQSHVIEIDLNTVQETQKVRSSWGLLPGAGPCFGPGLTPCTCFLPSTRWRFPASPS